MILLLLGGREGERDGLFPASSGWRALGGIFEGAVRLRAFSLRGILCRWQIAGEADAVAISGRMPLKLG